MKGISKRRAESEKVPGSLSGSRSVTSQVSWASAQAPPSEAEVIKEVTGEVEGFEVQRIFGKVKRGFFILLVHGF